MVYEPFFLFTRLIVDTDSQERSCLIHKTRYWPHGFLILQYIVEIVVLIPRDTTL